MKLSDIESRREAEQLDIDYSDDNNYLLSKSERDALCRVVRAAKKFMEEYGIHPDIGLDYVSDNDPLKIALSAFDWSDDE